MTDTQERPANIIVLYKHILNSMVQTIHGLDMHCPIWQPLVTYGYQASEMRLLWAKIWKQPKYPSIGEQIKKM